MYIDAEKRRNEEEIFLSRYPYSLASVASFLLPLASLGVFLFFTFFRARARRLDVTGRRRGRRSRDLSALPLGKSDRGLSAKSIYLFTLA